MSEMVRTGLSTTDRPAPLRAPVIVVDDFLPLQLAQAMRQDIEAHFAQPNAHRPETHQVWNYWFIPDLYTYLRTQPEKVIGRPLVEAFHETLTSWSAMTLGMAGVSWPYLSLYVDGCRQGWHNDALNGRYGFVYSLTRDQRRTIGGDTLVMREIDPFRANLARASAGSSFYEVVAPKFNRLVVFDDRLPHAVERIEGSMDPAEGRFVVHGHLVEAGAIVEGPRSADSVVAPARTLLERLGGEFSAQAALYHGPLVLRLSIDAAGTVGGCAAIVDRVIHPDPGHAEWEPLRATLIDRFAGLRFGPADGPAALIQPIIFGGALPRR